MIQQERIRDLNGKATARGSYVLYWMQAAQRAGDNHALEYAVGAANDLDLPVLVVFVLTGDYPEANLRHCAFMAEGLVETASDLKKRGIPMMIRYGDPHGEVAATAGKAALVVTDKGYLRHQRLWRERLAAAAPCRVVEVETDAVVPVAEAYGREAYSAAALRPRLERLLPRYLLPLKETTLRKKFTPPLTDGEAGTSARELLAPLRLDSSVGPVTSLKGGAREALRLLEGFIEHGLARYDRERNNPAAPCTSRLSPYLHFGQISPLRVALAVTGAGGVPEEARGAFLEELIVRRELSLNFVYYQDLYDRYEALPSWARETLEAHRHDPRPYLYRFEELEGARTHDPYWNAAQRELVETGVMHPYMRMYWGKQILAWSLSPEEAFYRALALNNRYALDGRDPNSYAGVAWCFGKHDRPWPRRPVFGTVRQMNAAGLRRKFPMEGYLHRFGTGGLPVVHSTGKSK